MRTTASFGLWAGIGAAGALGVLTVPTIGLFLLATVAALGAALAWRGHHRQAGPGIVTGLGLPLLYIGYLNRGGPGLVCGSTAVSQTCSQLMSPWPWAGAGLALLLSGAFWLAARRNGRHP
jgi:hypothetical protein